MAERDLLQLERVSLLRRTAQERRLAETCRQADAAWQTSTAAEQSFRHAEESERTLAAQCYARPADAQSWIARQHRAALVQAAEQRAQSLRQEAEALAARRSEEARLLLRGEARLDAVRQKIAAARRLQRAREEDMMGEEFSMALPVRSSR